MLLRTLPPHPKKTPLISLISSLVPLNFDISSDNYKKWNLSLQNWQMYDNVGHE